MSAKEKERTLLAVWDRIRGNHGDVVLGDLGDSDRVFAAIWMLEAELNNGGFSQWMFNSLGDHAELSVAALRTVGAGEAAQVCERFFSILPGGRPLPERGARQAQLDAAVSALGEDVFEDVCLVLEKEFSARADDLRDRLWAWQVEGGSVLRPG